MIQRRVKSLRRICSTYGGGEGAAAVAKSETRRRVCPRFGENLILSQVMAVMVRSLRLNGPSAAPSMKR